MSGRRLGADLPVSIKRNACNSSSVTRSAAGPHAEQVCRFRIEYLQSNILFNPDLIVAPLCSSATENDKPKLQPLCKESGGATPRSNPADGGQRGLAKGCSNRSLAHLELVSALQERKLEKGGQRQPL